MRVVERGEWGAAPPRWRQPLAGEPVRGLVVHYSGALADERAHHANCASRMRALQRLHMGARRLDDIAFNHLVCKHGYVFEGRGLDVRPPADRLAGGYLNVCFLGDEPEAREDVTEVGRRALAELVEAVRLHYPEARAARPHSDFARTPCPGDELRRFLDREEWREPEQPAPRRMLAEVRRYLRRSGA